jgi:hypothetical protein
MRESSHSITSRSDPRLRPPHCNENHGFVICVRDAEKAANAFRPQPFVYRLLQYAPVGAMKYLHFHQERFSFAPESAIAI